MVSILAQRALKLALVQATALQSRYPRLKHPPTILYFAYGANLRMARFEKYGMNVRPVGVARLPRHELRFDFPCEYLGKSYASVAAAEAKEVWGHLFELDALAMCLLDTMEWSNFRQYRRIALPVETTEGKPHVAQVYQARWPRKGLAPSLAYKKMILESAKEFNFPQSYIDEVAAHPHGDNFPLDPEFSFIHPDRPRLGARQLRGLYLRHDRLREKIADWLRF